MKPLKLSIKAEAVDHFIYRGYLYLALTDGSIVRVGLYDIHDLMLKKYPEYAGILTLAFRRNNFWNSEACKCFLGIKRVEEALREEWLTVADNMEFSVELSELNPATILKGIKGMVLDMDIYAEKLLLGTSAGFFSANLNNPVFNDQHPRLKLDKKFDAKIYKISSGYGNSLLSLGNEGFTAADVLSGKKVKDRILREDASFSANWTAAGGIINYSAGNDFQFIGNRVKRSKESPDYFDIEKFDETFKDLKALLPVDNNLAGEILMSFNNRDKQFYVTEKGCLLGSDVKVKSANMSRLKPKNISDLKLNLNKLGEPLSGLTVADQTVIEFEEQLILIHKNNSFTLEGEGIVSMHVYPRSTHFRDIVSVTTDNGINLHAVSVFDIQPEQLFVQPKKYYSTRFTEPYSDFNII